jgi:DNA-directed RNA polymerase specialized sigma24 family protein
MSAPVAPAAPSPTVESSRPSLLLKIGAAISIALLALTTLSLSMATGWLFGVSVSTLYGGEVLSLTNGLEPEVFEPSYWLSLAFTSIAGIWSLIRRLRKVEHAWRPIYWYAVTCATTFGVFATIDAQDLTDVPDGLTTTATLGVAWLWTYVLPIVLLVLLIKGSLMLARAANKSASAAKRVVSGCSLSVLAALYLVGTSAMPGLGIEVENRFETLDFFRGPPGYSQTDREVYVKASTMLTSRKAREHEARRFDQSDIGKCFSMLFERDGSKRSQVEWGISSLSRSLRLADAEDLAFNAMLKVCRKYSSEKVGNGEKGLEDLTKLFRTAIRNAKKTLCKRADREEIVANDELPQDEVCDRFSSTVDGINLRRVMDELSDEDRYLLNQRILGRDSREVAELLGINEAAARQRLSRLLGRLEPLLNEQ